MEARGGGPPASLFPRGARWVEISSASGDLKMSSPWLGATASETRDAIESARRDQSNLAKTLGVCRGSEPEPRVSVWQEESASSTSSPLPSY
eukprot:843779-Pyramimonas_sp.AAC.1